MQGAKGRGSLILCTVHTALIRDVLAGMLQLGERDVPRADSHRLQLPPFPRQPKGAEAKLLNTCTRCLAAGEGHSLTPRPSQTALLPTRVPTHSRNALTEESAAFPSSRLIMRKPEPALTFSVIANEAKMDVREETTLQPCNTAEQFGVCLVPYESQLLAGRTP
ncbi:hypothetical protein AV530_015196 [Patagioenas fasciata monilis]|uniref:Uncharacterized protein n=1 Tax=Patagioenas fasciata monilis TaxID=372326 RepID=A0A1V4K1G3_PATFA|nr:hypothetical protein AV530_015196 [Patagioenas fasciata monilis]